MLSQPGRVGTVGRSSVKLGPPPAPPGNPPLFSVNPVISGTPTVGQTLTTTNGTASNAPTYARQWRRDGVAIGGATATTYALIAADEGKVITCAVTATNGDGSATAVSNGLGPVAAAPAGTTWSPTDKAAGVALTNANLTATVAGGTFAGARSTTSKSSGSNHAEFTVGPIESGSQAFGVTNSGYNLAQLPFAVPSVTVAAGNIFVNGSSVSALQGGSGSGAIVAFEIAGSDVYIQRQGSARQGPFTLSGSGPWFLAASGAQGSSVTLNTGASPFAITPTAGFGAWG